jgi:hypothetical protein
MAALKTSVATTLRATALLPLLTAGIAILFRYPPEQFTFYPPCPVYTLFHIQCPGCGATRALAALLHGHLSEAMHDNALFTLAFPFAIFWSIRSYQRFLEHTPFRWPRLPQPVIYTALLLAAFFTIARNL